MTSINKAIVVGNVGRNPEIKTTQAGKKIASFPVATSRKFKDQYGQVQQDTDWHNIVCFDKLAEVVEKYVKKASVLYVEGSMKTRKYIDKNGVEKYKTEIFGNTIQILNSDKDL